MTINNKLHYIAINTRQNNYYTVKNGDNLWDIAKQILIKTIAREPNNKKIAQLVSKITKINNLKDPDLIFAGQKLSMPNLLDFQREAKQGKNQ